jgi:hypothetical protein
MSVTQPPLISESAELIENRQLRKRLLILLQNVGRMDFCKRRPDGTPGCGQEIFWVTFRGDRPKPLNDDGSVHVCREVKP